MASRIVRTPPLPFPPEIDRDAFGHWFSGFTDGEGYFRLGMQKVSKQPVRFAAEFKMGLRADDCEVLALVHSFFGCGDLNRRQQRFAVIDGKPQVSFDVRRIPELAKIIVPHFHRYPLRAKKKLDFLLWEQGVDILYRVFLRKHPGKGRNETGHFVKWTPSEREQFLGLINALTVQRQYGTTTPVEPPSPVAERTLFDGL